MAGYEQAQALVESLNTRDAGVLRYCALTIGAETVVVVYDATTGRELGLL